MTKLISAGMLLVVSATVGFAWSNPLDLQYTEGQTAPRKEIRDPCIVREGDTYHLVFTMWPFRNREEKLLNEPNQGMCFNMAKLNLYQCLSVAKPYYEDVFCLGQHVLMDTGQCINKASGIIAPPPPMKIYANATPYGQSPVKKGGKKSTAKSMSKKTEASAEPRTPAKPKT